MTYCPYDIGGAPERWGLESQFIDTEYGRVAVRRSGTRTSETCNLYIHGVNADWATWTPLLQAQEERHFDTSDQALIDMPGFGDSENLLDRLPIADVGELFIAIVRSLGYSRLRIIGHSMGGFLTLDMASRHQDVVESIHIVAGSYFSILNCIQHPVASFLTEPSVAGAFVPQYMLARVGGFEETVARVAGSLGLFRLLLAPFVAHPFKIRDSVVRSMCDNINPRGLVLTAANADGYSADRQWAEITCPIWAVFGDGDKLVPGVDMSRLLKCQPEARCATVEDSGHLLHIEHPAEVLDALGLSGKPDE